MGTLTYTMNASLDGYIEDAAGGIDWTWSSARVPEAPDGADRRRCRSDARREEARQAEGVDVGLPEEHTYPMPDGSHARNAEARAAQQVKKGNLSKANERKIDRKADKILDKEAIGVAGSASALPAPSRRTAVSATVRSYRP